MSQMSVNHIFTISKTSIGLKIDTLCFEKQLVTLYYGSTFNGVLFDAGCDSFEDDKELHFLVIDVVTVENVVDNLMFFLPEDVSMSRVNEANVYFIVRIYFKPTYEGQTTVRSTVAYLC